MKTRKINIVPCRACGCNAYIHSSFYGVTTIIQIGCNTWGCPNYYANSNNYQTYVQAEEEWNAANSAKQYKFDL